MNYLHQIKSLTFGIAAGDALGVPVEFKARKYLDQNPVTDMIGYGTYYLPPGTWSDDSSLTLCLMESLSNGFDLNDISINFQRWLFEEHWTPRGKVFDVGIATKEAISRLKNGIQPELAGGRTIDSNGNGSLMRIAPLVFFIHHKEIHERYEITRLVSSLTHGHLRSIIACFYHLEFLCELMSGKSPSESYKKVNLSVRRFLESINVDEKELNVFQRLFNGRIDDLHRDEISGSGYVVSCLEASVWCLLTSDNYSDSVLKAVNLGDDTDTTAAVTGALAGLYYGIENIPQNWLEQLARKEEIETLCAEFAKSLATE